MRFIHGIKNMRKNRLNRKKKKNSKRKKSWIAIKAKVKEEAIKATPEICLLRCSNRSKRNMPRRTKRKKVRRNMKKIKRKWKNCRVKRQTSSLRNTILIRKWNTSLTLCNLKWAANLINCSFQTSIFLNKTLAFSIKDGNCGVLKVNLKRILKIRSAINWKFQIYYKDFNLRLTLIQDMDHLETK